MVRHFLMLVCSAALIDSASAFDAEAFAELARNLETTKQETVQSGTAIAVIHDGKVIYSGYFGYADIAKKKAVDADTKFYIASATKPFFALNVLILAEQGSVRTDATLAQLFPKHSFSGIDPRAVTVRHLLTHTAGIENFPLVWSSAYTGLHSPKLRMRMVGETKNDPEVKLGQFNYSNVGYNILSVALEQSEAMLWQQQLERNVLGPLSLRDTSAYVSAATRQKGALALPYSMMSAQPEQALYLRKSDSTMQAAGGMISTAPDLARFLIAQLEASTAKPSVLTKAIRTQQRAQVATDGVGYEDFARSRYAWGWYVGDYKGQRMLHHFGGFAGFHAHLSFMPEKKMGLVVLNNEDFLSSKLTTLIADYCYGTLLGEAEIARKVEKRFAELRAKASTLNTVVQKQLTERQARPWLLRLPLSAYRGRYQHPLLGDIDIALLAGSPERPQLRWGQLQSEAQAYTEAETVRVEFVSNSGQVIRFLIEDGKVVALETDDMRFVKQ
jgi:CubicO group peptidase (beta-lactamase class C family)